MMFLGGLFALVEGALVGGKLEEKKKAKAPWSPADLDSLQVWGTAARARQDQTLDADLIEEACRKAMTLMGPPPMPFNFDQMRNSIDSTSGDITAQGHTRRISSAVFQAQQRAAIAQAQASMQQVVLGTQSTALGNYKENWPPFWIDPKAPPDPDAAASAECARELLEEKGEHQAAALCDALVR